MPDNSQDQELKLVVNFVDNATPQLQRFRAQLNETASAASQSFGRNTEELEKRSKRITENAKGIHEAVTQATKGFSRFATEVTGLPLERFSKTIEGASRGIGGFGLAVGAIPLALYGIGKSLDEFGKKMVDLDVNAKALGVPVGTIKNLVDQLGQYGLSGSEAMQNISGFIKSIEEASRPGTAAFANIQRQFRPDQIRAAVREIKQALEEGHVEKAINTALADAQQQYDNLIKAGYSVTESARQRRTILESLFGLSSKMLEVSGELKEATEEQQKDLAHQVELGKQYVGQWNALGQAFEDVGDKISTKLVGPIGDLTKLLKDNAGAIGDFIGEEIDRDIRDLKGLVDTIQATVKFVKEGTLQSTIEENRKKAEAEVATTGKPVKEYGPVERLKSWLPHLQQGGIVTGPTLAMLGEHGSEAVIPLGSSGLADAAEEQTKTTADNTTELKRLNDFLTGARPVGFGGGGGGGLGAGPGGGGSFADRVLGPGGGMGGLGGGPINVPPMRGGGAPGGVRQSIGSGQSGDEGTASSAGDPASSGPSMGAAQALAFARQHLGQDERADRSKLSSFFASKGIKIDPASTAWCAAFVNAELKEAGMKGTIDPETGKPSLAAGSFTKWGHGVGAGEAIQPGDVGVVRGFSPRTGLEGKHVGFLTGQTRTRDGIEEVQMLGGNQGGTSSRQGGVSEQWRPRSSLIVRRTNEEIGPGVGEGAGDTAAGPTGGGSNALARMRGRVGQELQDPEARRLLMASIAAENPKDPQAYTESVMNRALAQKQTLTQILRNPKYYPDMTKSKLGRSSFSDAERAKYNAAIGEVLGGSNITDLATGNELGPVRSGGAPITYRSPSGERYVGENWTKGWRESARAAIDRDTVQTAKVEGTGKLDVNVNAPAGTSVRAQGGGIFKKTNMTRQTQMAKADTVPAEAAPP
jgi:hypothetical protein